MWHELDIHSGVLHVLVLGQRLLDHRIVGRLDRWVARIVWHCLEGIGDLLGANRIDLGLRARRIVRQPGFLHISGGGVACRLVWSDIDGAVSRNGRLRWQACQRRMLFDELPKISKESDPSTLSMRLVGDILPWLTLILGTGEGHNRLPVRTAYHRPVGWVIELLVRRIQK